MKRTIIIISCILVIALLIGLMMRKNNEKEITEFVLINQSELLDISQNHLNGDASIKTYKHVQIDGVFDGVYPIVQFFYKGFGIVPSSKYYGFYYSKDNMPVDFQNAGCKLRYKSADVWEWSFGTDNGGITKRICDNWFYYEACF